jgi:hypothetical protein
MSPLKAASPRQPLAEIHKKPITEVPDTTEPNCLTNSSQQEDKFSLSNFILLFTNFRPEHLFAFTRTLFTAAYELTGL